MPRQLIPGFRFSNGRLIISTEQEVNILGTWPHLEARRKQTDGPLWIVFMPRFRLLRPKSPSAGSASIAGLGPEAVPSRAVDPAFEKLTAFLNFRRAIPATIASAVERTPSRQFAVLQMCQQRQRATELLEKCPALGFATANVGLFRFSNGLGAESAARLSCFKQRDIATCLGFPGSQAWVNILSKIPPGCISVEALLSLRAAAHNREVEKLLCHVGVVTAGTIALVAASGSAQLVTPSLLAEVAATPEENYMPQVAHWIEDIVELRTKIGDRHSIQPLRSIAEVRREHQEAVDAYARLPKSAHQGQLPAPPIPGTEIIIPIDTVKELHAEGNSQHNCVGSYERAVRRGHCYIYRVLSPERATLSIAPGPDGSWAIQQLRLACNMPPSPITHQAVQQWLDRYSMSV